MKLGKFALIDKFQVLKNYKLWCEAIIHVTYVEYYIYDGWWRIGRKIVYQENIYNFIENDFKRNIY